MQIRPGIIEEAVYKEQSISEYSNNPLIEALPPIWSKGEIIERLYCYPSYDKNERKLDARYRLHICRRLSQYFQVLPIHIDLENRISCMIRQGYIARNPFDRNFTVGLNQVSDMVNNRNIDDVNRGVFSSTGLGLTVIGEPGMGKTISIQRVLSTYPQIILHSQYKGKAFNQYQITWLKLDTPHDGSIKGICLDFLMKVDGILKTSYYNSSRNLATNALLPIVCQIAYRTCMGLIAIDEIQNLCMRGSGSEACLNFFMTLMNIGIPVILIGTNKAMTILQNQFRQARRSMGQGMVCFERIKSKDDKSWLLFTEGLLSYQWIRKPFNCFNDISDALYEESQGILDVASKLYLSSQVKSIVTNKEEITPYLIKQTAKEHLTLIKPMLDALKTGNPNKIALYDDIVPINLDEFISQQESQININDKIREIQKLKRREPISDNHIREEAIARLIELDVEPFKAKKNVEVVLKENTIINVKEIVKLAYRMTIEDDKVVSKKGKKEKAIQSFDEKDLRYIVQEGKKYKELSAYQALLESGYIKPSLL